MSNTMRLTIPQAGDIMRAAPRQVWLATLGAAAVTRDWAEKEAGSMFRALVNEGAAVESKAIRFIGEGVDTSVKRATRVVRDTRNGVTMSVASLANAASTFVRARLPAMRASIQVESAPAPHKASVKRTPKAAKPDTASRRRTAKRGTSR
jgi:hypothetical protein